MKKLSFILVVFSAVCLLAAGDLLARGGGGGLGGGGMSRGGGASFSRPSAGRTPSVSRPSPRPSMPSASRPSASRPSAGARPSVGTRPSAGALPGAGTRPSAGTRPGTGVAARPSAGQLQSFLDLSPSGGAARPSTLPATRPGSAGLGGAVAGGIAGGIAGGAAADFLRDSGARPSTLPATGQGPGVGERPGVGQRPGIGERPGAGQLPADRPLAANRPDRIQNREGRQGQRQDRRGEIGNQLPVDRGNWFNNNFWQSHPHPHWRFGYGRNWWAWATWGGITGWVGYGWTDPSYYNYGENIYYEGDAVYYGDQAVASAEEYAQHAEQIATSVPQADPEKVEWLPLGVFALTPDGQSSGPPPTMFLQLAISKEGIIAGTFQNTATDSVQSVEGMADRASQRAAWTVVGKTRPIMETGVLNLTENTAPALVHFADGQTQQWLLARLEEPKSN